MSEIKFESFVGTVEWAPQFKEPTRQIEAQVNYQLTASGELNFLAVRYEGDEIPLQQISGSSLIQAYAKHRGIHL